MQDLNWRVCLIQGRTVCLSVCLTADMSGTREVGEVGFFIVQLGHFENGQVQEESFFC